MILKVYKNEKNKKFRTLIIILNYYLSNFQINF